MTQAPALPDLDTLDRAALTALDDEMAERGLHHLSKERRAVRERIRALEAPQGPAPAEAPVANVPPEVVAGPEPVSDPAGPPAPPKAPPPMIERSLWATILLGYSIQKYGLSWDHLDGLWRNADRLWGITLKMVEGGDQETMGSEIRRLKEEKKDLSDRLGRAETKIASMTDVLAEYQGRLRANNLPI